MNCDQTGEETVNRLSFYASEVYAKYVNPRKSSWRVLKMGARQDSKMWPRAECVEMNTNSHGTCQADF
jgi:hypothetical protein